MVIDPYYNNMSLDLIANWARWQLFMPTNVAPVSYLFIKEKSYQFQFRQKNGLILGVKFVGF